MALNEFGGKLWYPKDKLPLGFTGPFWDRAYLVYQIHTEGQGVSELVIERDHDPLMAEAYGVLCQVLA